MDIVLIEKDYPVSEKIVKYFKDDDAINLVVLTCAEEYCIDSIPRLSPHIVIIDISNDNDIVEYIENTGSITQNIKGIFITNRKNDFSALSAYRMGFEIIMPNPPDMQILRNNIMEYNKEKNKVYLSSPELETRINNILNSTGISGHFDGYKYLRYSITLCYRDEAMLNGVTKNLYPCVANYFSNSAKSVERSMCRAVAAAWKNKCGNNFYKRMGCHIKEEDRKPTNKEFISAVIKYLKANT